MCIILSFRGHTRCQFSVDTKNMTIIENYPKLPSLTNERLQVHQGLEILYNTSTTTCLVLEFYCVMNSTLVSVFGPTYALNGPSGSMHIAVQSMREERLTILYAFGLGSFAFGVSQVSRNRTQGGANCLSRNCKRWMRQGKLSINT